MPTAEENARLLERIDSMAAQLHAVEKWIQELVQRTDDMESRLVELEAWRKQRQPE